MSDKAPQEELFEFAPTTKFKLIYIFAIGDERHEGCLKIGDATLMTSKPFNEIIDNSKELNDAAAKILAKYPGVGVDDLFATLNPLDRKEHWSDTFHFKPSAVQIMSEQVSKRCLAK